MLLNEKHHVVYKTYSKLPLTARPLDLLYFLFFAMHLPATLIIDLQYIYPHQFIPSIMRSALDFYVNLSSDPLISGLGGVLGDNTHLTWFKTFIYLEGLFQVPVFILGLRALYKGSRSIYPLLALYGASSATTTLACLTTVLQTPVITSQTPPAFVKGIVAVGITQEQRLLLLSSYVPFFIIPLMIAVDMGMRCAGLINKAIKTEEEEKWE